MISRSRSDLADKLLEAALIRMPRHLNLLELYAVSANESRRREQALKRWRQLRRARPDYAVAWSFVAANARELGRLEEAAAAIKEALKLFPNDPLVISEAARVFEKAAPIFENAARNFDKERDYGSAADMWLRLELHPVSRDWVQVAATSLILAKRLDEAEGVLSRYSDGSLRADAKRWFDISFAAIPPRQADFKFHLEDGVGRFGQEGYAIPKVVEWVSDLATARAALRQILARDPRDVEARESYVNVLIRSDLFQEAEMELCRFPWPSEATCVILAGKLKMRRGDVRAAATDLTKYAETKPEDQTARFLIERSRAIDDLTSTAIEPTPADVLGPGPRHKAADARSLMLRFESIGCDCTIGLVQRYFGAEPLGMLRWTATSLDALIPALEAKFAGLGEPDNTEIFVGVGDELYLKDKKWNLVMHTFINANEISIAALHPKMCRRFVFLRNKFLSDVRDGTKTLVFKSSETSIEDLAALQRAVSTVGPAPILSIQRKSSRYFADVPKLTFELNRSLFVGFVNQTDTAAQSSEEHAEWLNIFEETEMLLAQRYSPAAQAGPSGQEAA